MKLPGFAYDARRRVATFYCFVPGTDGRKRHKRKLTGVPSRAEAIRLWTDFREELEREALEPAKFTRPPTLVASAHVVYERSFPAAGPVGSEGNAAAFSSDSTGRCFSRR